MSADPNGDLVEIASLLEKMATELRRRALVLDAGRAEAYCLELEQATLQYARAIEQAYQRCCPKFEA